MTDEANAELPKDPVLRAAVISPRMACAPIPKRGPKVATPVRPERLKKAKPDHTSDKPGPDGTVYQARRIRTGTTAVATLKVRCRPGTFEWRYGRYGNSLYHAGSDLARAWERAGIASSGQANYAGASGAGYRGQSDAQLMAMDRVRKITEAVGAPIMRRLVAYCVEGRTPKEIAATYSHRVSGRQVSDTLDLDLYELAKAMNYA